LEIRTGQNQPGKNRLLQSIVVVLFAIGISWLATLLQSREKIATTATTGAIFDYRVETVHTSKLDSKGRSIYELRADVLTHFPVKKYSLLAQPQLIQYLADGKRVETNAREAILFDHGKTIDMRGNVVMIQKTAAGRVEARTNSNTLRLELQ
jgi:LPS export ABC transporter protein LptC